MSAQHTPRPWEIGDKNNSNAEVCIGKTDMVASMCRESSYTSVMVMSRAEMLTDKAIAKAKGEAK